MTIAVDWDVKHQTKPKNLEKTCFQGLIVSLLSYCKLGNFCKGFVKINSSQNSEFTLSFTDISKSCPSGIVFYIANMSFKAIRENKILTKICEIYSTRIMKFCMLQKLQVEIEPITKALTRLCVCAGWSAPLLFRCNKVKFFQAEAKI